ncbi:DUF6261 family protein [Saccharicrinis aurantiacus]|uniref:DUF6261 family protein n=1 Tax=Saccharicrinis aurantiacus TaxID=1849719 RepID=UPI00248F9F6C|nr:DUF6261 family protein [Saccharicrinis aurantiacus]
MKIKSIELRKLRNAESLEFNLMTLGIIKQSNTESIELPFATQILKQEERLQVFSNSYKLSNRSEYTAIIRAYDAGRDDAIKGLKANLLPFSRYHADSTVRKKASLLLYIIDKYGSSIHAKPDAEETAIVSNLIDELLNTPEYVDILNEFNMMFWVDALKENNTAFKVNYIDRAMEAADKPMVALADQRKELEAATKEIFDILEVFALMQKGIYNDMILSINALIDKHTKSKSDNKSEVVEEGVAE